MCPVGRSKFLWNAHGRPWTQRSHARPWEGLEAKKEGVEPFVGGIRPEPSPPLPPVIGADSSEVTGRTGAGAGTSIGGTAGVPLVLRRAVDLRAPRRLAVDRLARLPFTAGLRGHGLRARGFLSGGFGRG